MGVPCSSFQKKNIVLIHVFKEYCALLFFKGALLKDTNGVLIQQMKNVQATCQIWFTNVREIVKMEPILKAYNTTMRKSDQSETAIKSGKPAIGIAGKKISIVSSDITAEQFVKILKTYSSIDERKKIERYFKSGKGQYGEGDDFMGVRMGQVFALAKRFIGMPPGEIEKLLESPIHEVRAGGVSIMDFQARSKKTSKSRMKELFDLYIKRHDRINNWDLVDRAAPFVVGGYLFDKPRDILYKLARSKNIWERRTAIVSTYYFVRAGEVADTFKIAEILLNDKHDLIHKATGGWLRAAGGKDPKKLLSFLDQYAATMPRTTLRYAIEHLDKKQRDHYLNRKIVG